MYLKHLSSGKTIPFATGNFPKYTDKTAEVDSARTRTQSLDVFQTSSSLLVNDQVELVDNVNNVNLATFTITETYYIDGSYYYKTEDIESQPGTSVESTPRVVLNSYSYDGTKERWETPIMNQTLNSYDNIISKQSNTSNNNSLSYDHNKGIITISRSLN